MRLLFGIGLLWSMAAAAAAEPKAPLPPAGADGECAVLWAAQGFRPTAEAGHGMLYAIGAAETYDEFYARLQRERCWKEWLIVVYMAADNSLSPYSYRDLWEMQAAGSAPDVDTVVFHDSRREDGFRYYHIARRAPQRDYRLDLPEFIRSHGLEESDPMEQEEAFLNENGPGLVVSPVVRELPEGNSADGSTIAEFLRWALTHYPSRRVAFIGWSHGVGFAGPEDLPDFPFASGTREHDYLPVGEVTGAAGATVRELRGGKPLDIAGSDACLNQQVEVGYEWLGLADYLFGSSTIVQKKGFNYHSLLHWFNRSPRLTSAELAARIPVLYGRSVTERANGKYSSYADPYATMATWAESELPALKRTLEALAGILMERIASAHGATERITRSEELRRQLQASLRLGGTSNDLYNLLQVLEVWARSGRESNREGAGSYWQRLLDADNQVQDALERSVLARFVGAGYQRGLVQTSKAVAIWLPASREEYRRLFPIFARSQFYRGESPGELSAWGRMVQAAFGY